MIKLLIVRHGNSVSNVAKTFTGHIDAPLSEIGYKQAELVSDFIYNNFKVDKIYSSDLSRAVDTIKPFAERSGMKIIKDKQLREMYGGEWESKLFADLPILYPQDYKIWKEQPENARPTGGEAYTEVQARILDFVNKIAKEDDGKTVVIATHGGIIKSFRCAVKGVPLKEMNSVPFAVNASVLEIDCDGKTFTERGEYSDYLKDLQTEMPKGI